MGHRFSQIDTDMCYKFKDSNFKLREYTYSKFFDYSKYFTSSIFS